jgi:formylglycine-generating enzyme required for sulfatase activity
LKHFFCIVVVVTLVTLADHAGHAQTKNDPPKTFTNSIGMKFVWVPPGAFLMGSPKEEVQRHAKEIQHKVTLTKGFYMGVYTVTQEEYEKVMDKNPSYFSAGGGGNAKVAGLNTRRFPVEVVSWSDAKEFCRKLGDKEGKMYRLPTEAEWEYACRAGTKTAFYFGDTISTDQANYDGNFVFGAGKKGMYRQRTTEVGFFAAANGFGLHDMHGNVYQWCEDWYDKDYYRNSPKTDPLNTKAATYRVLRGGSWYSFPWFCRSAYRGVDGPDLRNGNFGFRVVLSSP